MTVNAQTPYTIAVGNGVSTVFPFTFKILNESDLVVTVDGITTPGTAYSIDGLGVNSGGEVTFLIAPTTGAKVILERIVSLDRAEDYQYAGDLKAEVLNPDFDRVWMALQQVSEYVFRAIRLKKGSSIPPEIEPTANTVIGFDALKNLISIPIVIGTSLADIASSIGSSLVGFIQAGVGAIARTMQDKARETVSILDFTGASGDGVTDNTAAFNLAKASGVKKIVFPAGGVYVGEYTLDQTMVIEAYGAILKGKATSQFVVKFDSATFAANNSKLLGGTIDMTGMADATTSKGIYTKRVWQIAVRDINIIGAPTSGNKWGVYMEAGTYISEFSTVEFNRMRIVGNSLSDAVTTISFNNCSFEHAKISYAIALTFLLPTIQGTADKLDMDNVSGITLLGGDIEGHSGVYLKAGAAVGGVVSLNNVLPTLGQGGTYKSGTFLNSFLLDFEYTEQQLNLYKDLLITTNVGTRVLYISETGKHVRGNVAGSVSGAKYIDYTAGNEVLNKYIDDFTNKALNSRGTSQGWRLDSAQSSDGAAVDLYLATGGTDRVFLHRDGMWMPVVDNTQALGGVSNRWSQLYAGTATINTSDAREKQQIRTLNEQEKAVAIRLKGLVRAFKFNDAVAEKGSSARIHFGVIAQDVEAAFTAEGLNAENYALLCYDEWVAEDAVIDQETGDVISEAKPAGNRYGVRYEELLAFVISAM